MSDIVERLRRGARFATDGLHRDLIEAADEIERLRNESEWLQGRLERSFAVRRRRYLHPRCSNNTGHP